MLKQFLIILILITYGFSEEKTEIQKKEEEYRNKNIKENTTKIHKTYRDATNDESTKNWNNKDWESHLQKNGVFDTGLIGNSQSNTSVTGSDIIHNANPNQMSTSSLRQNDALKDNKAIFGYSEKVEKSILDGNNQRVSGNININQSTKCYIAREMPVRFKCSKTGLIYGAGINTGGADAQRNCELECYEQYACANVSPQMAEAGKIIIDNQKLIKGQEKIIIEKYFTNESKIEFVSFEPKKINKKVFLDIVLIFHDDSEKIINKKLYVKEKKNTLKINQFAKGIKIALYGENSDAEIDVEDIIIQFKKEEKFICPGRQDISSVNSGEFAYVCPSGKVKTLVSASGSYTICEDYGVVGDNKDGTFSTEAGCNSICKNSFSCKLDNTAISNNSLQNFREGCIEGQSDCNLETCRSLRIGGAQVINENVFHGDFEAKPTVVNGALVQGVERPKVLLKEDLDFLERSKEEWKDGAYNDMIQRGAYRATKFKINEDTLESSAYNMGISSNSTEASELGAAVRTLYWAYKPKAFDVGSESFKLFAVLEVIVDNIRKDEYGNNIRVRDKILYVKTSNEDFFKPFAIKQGYAKKTSNQIDDAEVLTSIWEYKYFNESSKTWIGHSKETSLEYFRNGKIELNGPFLRIPIVHNYNRLMYNLPGIIRSIKRNGPDELKTYGGVFDGSGQAITSVKLFVDSLKQNDLTYSSVIEKIESGEWEAIYDNKTQSASPNNVKSDTNIGSDSLTYHKVNEKKSKEDIEIFLYGKENNKTGYTRIKPKTEDIGKKGFIYIFAQ